MISVLEYFKGVLKVYRLHIKDFQGCFRASFVRVFQEELFLEHS